MQALRSYMPLWVVVAAAGLAAEEGRQDRGSLPAETITRVERAVRETQARQQIPGISVAVSEAGHRWSAGFGLADVENQVPASAHTVYRLASVSKPITAVAVMRLVESGQLDLDTPIQRYVPEFPEKPWPIVARHLLSHQAGIRWYRGDEMQSTRHFRAVREGLGMFRSDPLVHEPGTRFLYTSYGYNLLGAAIEGASGQPYLSYVRRNIFTPAGMVSTRDDNVEAVIPHRASGYHRDKSGELHNSQLSDTSNKIPGGGLCGTAADLVAFATALQGGKLLKPETTAAMFRPQKTDKGVPTGYGLGWHIGHHEGRQEVWHAGSQPQVSTLLYMQPERHRSVAVMCNLEGAQLMDLARRIADDLDRTH